MADEENGDSVSDDWAAAMEQQEAAGSDVVASALEEISDDSSLATQNVGVDGSPDLEVILDIPVTLSMEVGTTEINIRNLLQLTQGSVVELNRLAGEPLDVMVNSTLVAHGEVVVVNDKFGIRLTDIVSPAERVSKLK